MLTVISFTKSDLKMHASTTGEQEVPVESTDNYPYTHLTTLSTKEIPQCIKKMFSYALSKSMCEVSALKTMSSYRHLTYFSAVTILFTVTAQNMYLRRQLRHTTCKPVLLLNTIQVNNHILEVMYNQKYIYQLCTKLSELFVNQSFLSCNTDG